MKEELSLEKKNEIHQKLVDGLKKALLLGQYGFLEAGKYLYKIWSEKTYLAEDASQETTFTEFLQRPDLPIPGHTRESRLRIAQKLIRIYKFFLLEKKYPKQLLAPLGYSKLDMLVSTLQKEEQKEEVEEWLEKAKSLSVEDLKKEILQRDKSLSEILTCPHKEIEEITIFVCKNCKTSWKKDPRTKR